MGSDKLITIDESERNELVGIFKYFDDYWMRRILMWNCFTTTEQKNNFCESKRKTWQFHVITKTHVFIGYNYRFTARLNKKHRNIYGSLFMRFKKKYRLFIT